MNPQNSSSGLMRFSKAARMVLQRAHVVAVEQRSSLILPAHLLLALAAEEQGMAGQVLHESQITPETIQHLLSPGKQKSPATINLSPSVQRVLAGAIPIAKEWRSAVIGTTQLLVSLLTLNDPFVQQVLQEVHTSPEEIRAKLANRKKDEQ